MMDVTQADQADFRESMGWFEAAAGAKVVALVEPALDSILLALDGSNQDEASISLALALARRHGASIHALDCSAGDVDRSFESGDDAPAVQWEEPRGGAPAAEQILETSDRVSADLVIACAPFGEDFDRLGDASTGSTLDLLLKRLQRRLLVLRSPEERVESCTDRIALPITPYDRDLAAAGGWALRLLPEDGRLTLLGVVDGEAVEAAGRKDVELEDLSAEELAGLHHPEVAGLIAALQRLASERDFDCRVMLRTGELIPEILAATSVEGGAAAQLIIVRGSHDPTSGRFSRAQALIRGTRNPVLIV